MCKGTSKNSDYQEKTLFSLPEIVSDKKIRVYPTLSAFSPSVVVIDSFGLFL